jgi:hypothetical protein
MSTSLFKIESFSRTDTTLHVELTGKPSQDIPLKDFNLWLARTGRLERGGEEEGIIFTLAPYAITADEYWEEVSDLEQGEDIHNFLLSKFYSMENHFESLKNFPK